MKREREKRANREREENDREESKNEGKIIIEAHLARQQLH